ncbi:hypothetical protein BgiBS90_003659, partial [Biomphalaria glabrata]
MNLEFSILAVEQVDFSSTNYSSGKPSSDMSTFRTKQTAPSQHMVTNKSPAGLH